MAPREISRHLSSIFLSVVLFSQYLELFRLLKSVQPPPVVKQICPHPYEFALKSFNSLFLIDSKVEKNAFWFRQKKNIFLTVRKRIKRFGGKLVKVGRTFCTSGGEGGANLQCRETSINLLFYCLSNTLFLLRGKGLLHDQHISALQVSWLVIELLVCSCAN